MIETRRGEGVAEKYEGNGRIEELVGNEGDERGCLRFTVRISFLFSTISFRKHVLFQNESKPVVLLGSAFMVIA